MVRPRCEHPTPNELEILQVVWERRSCTVRQVMNVLNETRHRAYTSILSLMNIMHEKGLLNRRAEGKAFLYEARDTQDKTLAAMVADLLRRGFRGSADAMVGHLLEQTKVSGDELEQIRRTIAAYEGKQGGRP